MTNIYASTIRYFLIMLLMLLFSGFWMFIEHTSLNIQELTQYYAQKSLFGLLETVNPHLFGMGVVIFTLTHFLALKNKNTPLESKLSIGLFTVMIFSNLSGFFIEESTILIAWIKLGATLLLMILSSILIVKVYFRTR